MGILTELFVATPDEAAGHDGDARVGSERVQLGGLTSLEFESLWAILEEEEWNPEKHSLREVAASEETWVFAFPDACIDRLRQVKQEEIPDAAMQWAATEELDGSDPSDLVPAVEALVRLAGSARSGGRGLFLWSSL